MSIAPLGGPWCPTCRRARRGRRGRPRHRRAGRRRSRRSARRASAHPSASARAAGDHHGTRWPHRAVGAEHHRAAPSSSVSTAAAPESSTWYATSSAVKRLFSGTRQNPALKQANIASSISGRLRMSTPTRSPRDCAQCAECTCQRVGTPVERPIIEPSFSPGHRRPVGMAARRVRQQLTHVHGPIEPRVTDRFRRSRSGTPSRHLGLVTVLR